MKRETVSFSLENISVEKLIGWVNKFDVFTFFNSNPSANNPPDLYSNFDYLLAIGAHFTYDNNSNPFNDLKVAESSNDWHIVNLSYDLKNNLEDLHSNNSDFLGFAQQRLYIPEIVFEIKSENVAVHFFPDKFSLEQIKLMIEEINSFNKNELHEFNKIYSCSIRQKISKEKYISSVENIKDHIQRGDIYEMNFCQEFYSEECIIHPPTIYQKLNDLSPMPFSVFSKHKSEYIICASPERYLAKRDDQIISQPIKGTARRGENDFEDKKIAQNLFNDPKERSENVMIVDLVRNDLSRTALKGSVSVQELFGIKTYQQLHQMVSTITSRIESSTAFSDVIATTFPMGSMTGAPKIRAMQLIEELEDTKRGMYSGSIGYLAPNGHADFNVVIRSILYNQEKKYLSFIVGSAITIGSVAEKEYEECLLKASAMIQVLKK